MPPGLQPADHPNSTPPCFRQAKTGGVLPCAPKEHSVTRFTFKASLVQEGQGSLFWRLAEVGRCGCSSRLAQTQQLRTESEPFEIRQGAGLLPLLFPVVSLTTRIGNFGNICRAQGCFPPCFSHSPHIAFRRNAHAPAPSSERSRRGGFSFYRAEQAASSSRRISSKRFGSYSTLRKERKPFAQMASASAGFIPLSRRSSS